MFLCVAGGSNPGHAGLQQWADWHNVILASMVEGVDDDKAIEQWAALQSSLQELPVNKQLFLLWILAANRSQWGMRVAEKGDGIVGAWFKDPKAGGPEPKMKLLVGGGACWWRNHATTVCSAFQFYRRKSRCA